MNLNDDKQVLQKVISFFNGFSMDTWAGERTPERYGERGLKELQRGRKVGVDTDRRG